MRLDDRDLPTDPRSADWTPAQGPDGPAWVWFDVHADHWIVWDEDRAYRRLSNREFDADYELDVGPTGFEIPDE